MEKKIIEEMAIVKFRYSKTKRIKMIIIISLIKAKATLAEAINFKRSIDKFLIYPDVSLERYFS